MSFYATYTIEGEEAQVKDFRELRVPLYSKDIQHGIYGLCDELDIEADLFLVFEEIDGSCQYQGQGSLAAQGVLKACRSHVRDFSPFVDDGIGSSIFVGISVLIESGPLPVVVAGIAVLDVRRVWHLRVSSSTHSYV